MFGDVLSEVGRKIYDASLIGHHGPGKTADRLDGNQKWTLPEWTTRLEEYFPYGIYALPNHRYWEHIDQVEFLSPAAERPAKLTAVAKTHTTPRLISIEPTCMQYVQQAISRPLREHLERHKVSRHFLGFEHQWPNQAMAQRGSLDGSLATLDLSEASDRVANWIVEDMFSNYPNFLDGVQACRSTSVRLPSGEVIKPLLKFASMGSAMTFPMEAMVFVAIVLEGVLRQNDLPLSLASVKRFKDVVRVYGDDIIVPTDCAETVIDSLEVFGLKVNRSKSHWTGGFRESCGKEYWKGYDVSVVRFRKELPASRHDADRIVSTVATRNLFFKAGLHNVVAVLDEVLIAHLRYFPFVSETSPVLGRLHPTGLYQIDRRSRRTHAPQVRGYVMRPRSPSNEIDDVHALMKCLVEPTDMPNISLEHLMRSGRPLRVSINAGYGSPF